MKSQREIFDPKRPRKAVLDFKRLGGLVWTAVFTPDGSRILSVGGNDARIWGNWVRRGVDEFQSSRCRGGGGLLARRPVDRDGIVGTIRRRSGTRSRAARCTSWWAVTRATLTAPCSRQTTRQSSRPETTARLDFGMPLRVACTRLCCWGIRPEFDGRAIRPTGGLW